MYFACTVDCFTFSLVLIFIFLKIQLVLHLLLKTFREQKDIIIYIT